MCKSRKPKKNILRRGIVIDRFMCCSPATKEKTKKFAVRAYRSASDCRQERHAIIVNVVGAAFINLPLSSEVYRSVGCVRVCFMWGEQSCFASYSVMGDAAINKFAFLPPVALMLLSPCSRLSMLVPS